MIFKLVEQVARIPKYVYLQLLYHVLSVTPVLWRLQYNSFQHKAHLCLFMSNRTVKLTQKDCKINQCSYIFCFNFVHILVNEYNFKTLWFFEFQTSETFVLLILC